MVAGTFSSKGDTMTTETVKIDIRGVRGLPEWITLYQAYNAVFKVNEMALLPQGISLPQLHLLALLSYADRPLSTGEIARAMVKAAQSITGLVDRLVARKMVRTKGDPKDRRRTLVVLTDVGRAKLQESWPIANQVGKELFDVLSDREMAELKATCKKLRDHAVQKLGIKLEGL